MLRIATFLLALWFPLVGTTWYVKNDGTGDGTGSCATADTFGDIWTGGPVVAGDTIIACNGTYNGASNIINPPADLSGSDGSPITIQAETDGEVLLNGGGGGEPIRLLDNNDWWVIEGINAHNGGPTCCNGTIANISNGSDDNVFKRVVFYDADPDENASVFVISKSARTLVEDFAIFGFGRKSISSFGDAVIVNENFVTLRRGWMCFGGSNVVGPKMSYAPVYNARQIVAENIIAGWCANGTATDQEFGIAAIDRIDSSVREERRVHSYTYGSIFYTTNAMDFGGTNGILITKLDEVHLKDVVVFLDSDYTAYNVVDLSGCSTQHTGGSACDNTDMTITDATLIGGDTTPIIVETSGGFTQWVKTDVQEAVNVAGAPSIWNGATGANVCKQYVDGVLTSAPLWPWVMDTRIKEAVVDAGYSLTTIFGGSDNSVTDSMEAIFGAIPCGCRTDVSCYATWPGVLQGQPTHGSPPWGSPTWQ